MWVPYIYTIIVNYSLTFIETEIEVLSIYVRQELSMFFRCSNNSLDWNLGLLTAETMFLCYVASLTVYQTNHIKIFIYFYLSYINYRHILPLVICCLWSMVVLTKLEARLELKEGFREEVLQLLPGSSSWGMDYCRSVAQSCPTLCDPMDCSTPGFPVLHCLPELAQTHVHWAGDTIQPSHPLSSPSPPAFNLSQHQGLIQWVSSSHQVTKALELQLQHQSFQWIFRVDFL